MKFEILFSSIISLCVFRTIILYIFITYVFFPPPFPLHHLSSIMEKNVDYFFFLTLVYFLTICILFFWDI